MTYLFLFFTHFLGFNTPHPVETVKHLHAFHISKTDMTFKPQEKNLQMTLHIFIDDLELGLDKQGHKKLFIGTEREMKSANDLIFKYLQSNFSLKINNKDIAYTWVGKEVTSDKQAIWIYMEVKNIKEVKNITVENKVLTEVFSDQKNIVQVNIPAKKQGYFLLDKAKTKDSASF
jgi:DNA polymerase III alpha subunit